MESTGQQAWRAGVGRMWNRHGAGVGRAMGSAAGQNFGWLASGMCNYFKAMGRSPPITSPISFEECNIRGPQLLVSFEWLASRSHA